MDKIYVTFEGGISRHGAHGVNYMMCNIEDDEPLYAECRLPEGDISEFYGYYMLKEHIVSQAMERGIEPENLRFWDDEQDIPDPDASAAVDIETW